MPHDLHIVLIEPEIPQNTGSVGRLCLAVNATLHLVKPMGFEITHSRLKRAGLDYWEHINVIEHDSLEAYLATLKPETPLALFTKKAGHTLFEHEFKKGVHLVFGKETMGLPDWLVNRFPRESVRIPMYDARVRSLNLSNAASIAAYEAIRQLGA